MPFSPIFIALLSAGIIPVALGGIFQEELIAFLCYNFLLTALFFIDYYLTPGKKAFVVTRTCEEKLSMGGQNKVLIKVRNNSDFDLKFKIRDDFPEFFEVDKETLETKVAKHDETHTIYHVTPLKRGEFVFKHIHIRFYGLLNLCMKTIAYDSEENHKVYPNLRDITKYGFKIANKNSIFDGFKKIKALSLGSEFESLREYVPGDDVRKINYMATARINKLVVNTYEDEKNQQVIILLDSSRVMKSEINRIKKIDYAINAAFLLTDVALKKGDRLGLIAFDSIVRRLVKPGKGHRQFEVVAQSLYNVEENMVSADFNGVLRVLNTMTNRRSLLCIFTELFNTEEALYLVNALKTQARRHIPIVITINDPRVDEICKKPITCEDDLYLKASAIKLLDDREKIRGIFAAAKVPCIDVAPDKLSVEIVNKYLKMKSKMEI